MKRDEEMSSLCPLFFFFFFFGIEDDCNLIWVNGRNTRIRTTDRPDSQTTRSPAVVVDLSWFFLNLFILDHTHRYDIFSVNEI